MWRDWGLPHLGVGDAHRASFYAPQSAGGHNTYGTLMQALGRYEDAKVAYELASKLDPRRRVCREQPLLCLVSRRSDSMPRSDICTRAVKIGPVAGRSQEQPGARVCGSGTAGPCSNAFSGCRDDPASGLYNTGIVYLASRDYRSAAGRIRRSQPQPAYVQSGPGACAPARARCCRPCRPIRSSTSMAPLRQ